MGILDGRVAVVTGAGRGIGRAEAIALAKEGAKVVVNDLGVERDGTGATTQVADTVVEEIKGMGGEAVPNYDSVTDPKGAENIIKTAVDSFGRIDILVNNAGILRDRMVFNMTDEEWDLVIKTHLYGTFYCTRAAAKYMREQRYGRIINTSSHAGLGNMGQANYSAAKEGIVGFTRTVARDLGRYGITVNAIRPRAGTRMTVNPELKAAWAKMWGPEEAERHEKELLELFKPEEIAVFVVFLASDFASNVNGRVFEVWRGHIGLFAEPVPVEQILWKDGSFTVEELIKALPTTLTRDLTAELPPSGFKV